MIALRKLRVRNFRAVASLDLELPEGVRTVCFVGPNGSGKSSLLSWLLHGLITLGTESTPDVPVESLRGVKHRRIMTTTEIGQNAGAFAIVATWRFDALAANYHVSWTLSPESASSLTNDLGVPIPLQGREIWTPHPGEQIKKLVVLERPASRFETPYYEDDEDIAISPQFRQQWVGTRPLPFRVISGLHELEVFLMDLAIDSLMERAQPEHNQLARMALETFGQALGQVIQRPTSFRVGTWPYRRVGMDAIAALSLLSAGELDLMVTIGAIVAQSLYLARRERDFDLLSNPRGIVVIDEVDTHLHPAWQEKIVPLLVNTFPSILFLLTTHSPFVLRSLQKAWASVVRLPDGRLFSEEFSKWSADEILAQVFGVNAPWGVDVEVKLRQLSAACTGSSEGDALALYQELAGSGSDALRAAADQIVVTHAPLTLRSLILSGERPSEPGPTDAAS